MRPLGVGLSILCTLAVPLRVVAQPPAQKPAQKPAPATKPAPKPVDPWLRAKPFEGSPKEMLAAAAAAKAPASDDDEWIQVLYEEDRYSWNADGAATWTRYRVWRVVASQEDLAALSEGDWDYLTVQEWSPWYQRRPELRTRIISADGAVTDLGNDRVSDDPVEDYDDEDDEWEQGDRRSVHHTLGLFGSGALIEHQATIVDSRPAFEGGALYEIDLDNPLTKQRRRLILDVPDGLAFTHEATGLAVTPTTQRGDGRRTITFETTLPGATARAWEADLPDDADPLPRLRFATGKSWDAVAAGYAKVLDERAAAGPVAATSDELKHGATDRAAIVEAVVEWYHDRITPTYVPVHRASLVPATPAETIAAKKAGVIDGATTLCALLRKAGLEADVVLVRSRFIGPDVTAKLSGLGLFDAALVRVRGEPAIWLNPTERLGGPNELFAALKGRQALVVATGTTGLIETPRAAATDDRRVETVEIDLAEARGARVTTTVERNDHESGWRRVQLREKPKQPQFIDWEAQSLSGRASSFENRTGEVPFAPLRYRFVVDEAGAYFTSDDSVKVAIEPVTDALPWHFRGEWNDRKPRARDFVFHEPFIRETRHVIKVPPGFSIPELPDSGRTALGPLTVETEVTVGDRVITVKQRLEIDHLRLTPAEYEAARTALLALDGDRFSLTFDITAMAKLRGGDLLAAIAEAEKMVDLHPKEALHHEQLAEIYLAGGMGTAGRREAERATTLEPKSQYAWSVRAWALEHDTFGRSFKRGYDRAGALAARKKAKALAADPTWYGRQLANLLVRDVEGHRFTPASDRAAALAELTDLVARSKEPDDELELAAALFWTGRMDEAIAHLRPLASSPQRSEILIACIAAAKGGADAVLELKALPDADDAAKDTALFSAVTLLERARRYSDASTLLKTAASRHPRAAAMNQRAARLQAWQPHDAAPPDAKSPTEAARRLVMTLVARAAQAPRAQWETALSRDAFPQSGWRYLGGVRDALANVGWRFDHYGETHATLFDRTFSETSCKEVSGDAESAWLIECRETGPSGLHIEAYFALEDGAVKFLAWRRNLVSLGARAYRLLGQGKQEAAQRMLDAALAESEPADASKYLLGSFSRLWTRGEERKDRVRVAAALLAAGLGDKKALADAKKCAKVIGDADACDAALVVALVQGGRFEDVLEPAERLAKGHAGDEGIDSAVLSGLYGARRFTEVRERAEALLAKDPQSARGRNFAPWAIGATDLAAMRRWYLDLFAGEKSDSSIRNMIAWTAVAEGAVTEDDISIADFGLVFEDENSRYPLLNTIAAARALAGDPGEAYRVLVQSMELENAIDPTPSDLLVHGLIAERLGLPAVAIDDYEQIAAFAKKNAKPANFTHPVETPAIAARRLAALKAKRGKK